MLQPLHKQPANPAGRPPTRHHNPDFNPDLSTLRLKFCRIGDIVVEELLTSCQDSTVTADLSFNNLYDLKFPPLPKLRHLSLSGNFLSLSSFLTLPTTLISLDLAANPVKAGDLKQIRVCCPSLEYFGGNLTDVDYEECHGLLGMSLRSTKKDVSRLFPSSPSSPPSQYKKLDLGMNENLNFAALSSGLKNPGIEHLFVDNCNMSFKSLETLLSSLYPKSCNLHTIKSLNISFNPLPPSSFSTLFSTLTASPCLEELDTSGIPMNLLAAKTVAYFLAHNNSIKIIKVRNCSLDVSSQRHITAGLSSNTQSALESLQGITISNIALSLGFPKDMEGRSNEVIIRCLRQAWKSRGTGAVGAGGKWEVHKKFLQENHPHLRAPASPKEVLECVSKAWATFKLTLPDLKVSVSTTTSSSSLPSSSSTTSTSTASSSNIQPPPPIDPLSDTMSPTQSSMNLGPSQQSSNLSIAVLQQANFSWLRHYTVPYCKEEHSRLKTLYNSPLNSNKGGNKRKRSGLSRTTSMACFGGYGKNRVSYYPRIESYLATLEPSSHFLTLKRLNILESNSETGRIYGEAASSANYGFTTSEVEDFVIGPPISTSSTSSDDDDEFAMGKDLTN